MRIVTQLAEQHGVVPAEHVLERFQKAFRLLAGQPGAGHARDDLTNAAGVRFWAVFSYLVAYLPDERPMVIVGVIHGSRDPRAIRRHLRERRTSTE